jgi:hypothetical protein
MAHQPWLSLVFFLPLLTLSFDVDPVDPYPAFALVLRPPSTSTRIFSSDGRFHAQMRLARLNDAASSMRVNATKKNLSDA